MHSYSVRLSLWHLPRLVLVLAILLITVALWSTPVAVNRASAQTGQTPDEFCASVRVAEPATRTFSQAEQVLETGIDYHAIFCTQRGAIYVDLFERYTPVTTNNFVFLAQQGYYNNTTFHRVIADFMAQAGDPTGTGSGGPGYQFEDEVLPFLGMNSAGWLAMANAGPGTNGSQFFITRAATNWLHGRHTVFGQVLEGQVVVDSLTNREPPTSVAADSLNTVLIITEPDSVNTTYVPPTPATAEEALAAIESTMTQLFAQGPALRQLASTTLDLGGASAQFDDVEAARAWYEAHSLAYEANATWQIATCPTQPDLLGLGFAITDWGGEANAAAAVADEALIDLYKAVGFERVEDTEGVFAALNFSTDLVFTRIISDFCDTPGVQGRYLWNQGRYTLTLDVVIGEGGLSPEEFPSILANFGFVVNGYVSDIILSGGLPTLGFDE